MNTPMHRFKYTKLTKGQITKKFACADPGPECVSKFSDVLEGKSFRIITDDGTVLNYSFKDQNALSFSENNGASIKAHYGSLELKQMVLFSHMVPNTLKGYNLIIDLDTNLVTLVEVWFCLEL